MVKVKEIQPLEKRRVSERERERANVSEAVEDVSVDLAVGRDHHHPT